MGWKLPTLAAVLWVVALGFWAGVATGPIGGPWGEVAGSVLTVLAGVVTAYVPSFREEYRRRAADRADARETLRRAGELPGGGPAGLLDPRRGLVDFIGRERELAGLLEWCEEDRPHGVRLVTGPGGIGKTRLSVELCARLEQARLAVRPGRGRGRGLSTGGSAAGVAGPGAAGGGLRRGPAGAGWAAARGGRRCVAGAGAAAGSQRG